MVFWRKKKRSTIDISPQQFLKQLNVQIIKRINKDCYIVGFQGGYFMITFMKKLLVSIIYTDFAEFDYEQFIRANTAINSINSKYSGWTCYLNTEQNGKSEKPVKACMSTLISLYVPLDYLIQYVQETLNASFSIGRAFLNEFNNIPNGDELREMTLTMEQQNTLQWLLNKLDTGLERHIKEKNCDNSFSLADALSLYDGINPSDFSSLNIYTSRTCVSLHDAESIVAFDFINWLKEQIDKDIKPDNCITFHFKGQSASLIVCLDKVVGSTKKSLFFRFSSILNREISGVFSIRDDNSEIRQSLLEVRLSSAEDDDWEAKFMIDDAHDKQKAGKLDELSIPQKALLSVTNPSASSDYYWATKLTHEGCYIQSLPYYERLFYNYRMAIVDDENAKETFSSLCYALGIIYMQLEMYEKAMYYLFHAVRFNSDSGVLAYAKCLCLLRDPFAEEFIQAKLQQAANQFVDESDESNKELLEKIIDNLHRYLADTYIFMKKYDTAEFLLNKMLQKDGENSEFAKQRLAEISQLKKKEQKQQDNKSNSSSKKNL